MTALTGAPAVTSGAIVDAVTALAGEVFATVDALRVVVESVLVARSDPRAVPPGPLDPADLAGLETLARAALERPRGAVAGAGFVAEPGLLADRPHWLEWWTVGADRRRAVRLVIETDAGADGFRDYSVLPWFEAPRRTGRRHVTGPYVDYLCSDEYMLTFTAPVTGPAGFAGVVGADVPVRHVERLLLPLLVALPRPAALVNAGGRVVAGNRPTLVVGQLVRDVPVAALWAADSADAGGFGESLDAGGAGAVVLRRCADLPLALLVR